jgi:hypothetical protein
MPLIEKIFLLKNYSSSSSSSCNSSRSSSKSRRRSSARSSSIVVVVVVLVLVVVTVHWHFYIAVPAGQNNGRRDVRDGKKLMAEGKVMCTLYFGVDIVMIQ